MASLLAVIGSIVSGEARDAVGRAQRAAMIYLVAGLLGLAGLIFLLIAAFIAVAREIGALPAALWFGGGFLGLAVVIVAVHRIAAGIRARKAALRRKEETRTIVGTAAVALLPALLASRTGSIALLAPAIAALAYAVYRENTASRRDPPDDRPQQ